MSYVSQKLCKTDMHASLHQPWQQLHTFCFFGPTKNKPIKSNEIMDVTRSKYCFFAVVDLVVVGAIDRFQAQQSWLSATTKTCALIELPPTDREDLLRVHTVCYLRFVLSTSLVLASDHTYLVCADEHCLCMTIRTQLRIQIR